MRFEEENVESRLYFWRDYNGKQGGKGREQIRFLERLQQRNEGKVE